MCISRRPVRELDSFFRRLNSEVRKCGTFLSSFSPMTRSVSYGIAQIE